MYKLEHVEVDKKKKDNDEPRVEQIEDIQERMNDDFFANQYLRGKFRVWLTKILLMLFGFLLSYYSCFDVCLYV